MQIVAYERRSVHGGSSRRPLEASCSLPNTHPPLSPERKENVSVSAALEMLTESIASRLHPPARRLTAATDRSALDPVYLQMGTTFPALNDHLVLGYRWEASELSEFQWLANPGPAGLFDQLFYDPHFPALLLPPALLPFPTP